MTGTTTVLGRSDPDLGLLDDRRAGSATAPGPVLVVQPGRPGRPSRCTTASPRRSRWRCPGQPAGAFSRRAVRVGGPTRRRARRHRTYTFTAGRPGTFVYEAGHTAGGARQVAMGLAGALVVLRRTARHTASAPPYDDEAVLVLSEIDPALNAHPTTFDMRELPPGVPAHQRQALPLDRPGRTDQGHTVLLRYVNVGSQPHSMSLLGGDQTQVADDGHPLRYAESAVTLAVEPGRHGRHHRARCPPDRRRRSRCTRRRGHLDNNGQSTADPLSFAFGGMMTFLDTSGAGHRAPTAWARCRRT